MKTISLGALMLAGAAYAQVTPEIAKQLVNIGRGVCVPQTAQVYRPLQPNPPYSGITIARDQKFGPNGQDVADVFSAEKGGGNRTVLIYVPGGAGNKLQGGPNGDVFYDNVMVWATKNDMVGVLMQRHAGANWDDPGRDVGLLVKWVGENIKKFKGNPNRVFIWSQSAGNQPVAIYMAHPELWGGKEVGVKGVVFMSSPGFSILPAVPPAAAGFGTCNNPDGTPPAPVAAKGVGAPKGDGKGKGAPAQPDEATLLARSNLAGLQKSKAQFFVSAAELDPPGVIVFAETLRDQLCAAKHCPQYALIKDHSHISEVMSPNTADVSVTGPILKWIKGVK
ncbi:MAG: carboxylesterase family protein [Bryobacteraceae bacterium]